MMILLTCFPNLGNVDSENKKALSLYFGKLVEENLTDIAALPSEKAKAEKVNSLIGEIQKGLIANQVSILNEGGICREELLRRILMIKYVAFLNYLSFRNRFWKYDYMSLSRRIGEMWEPFCKTCFEYSLTELDKVRPMQFSEIKEEIDKRIKTMLEVNINDEGIIEEVRKDIDIIWGMVESGSINLELDYHVQKDGYTYHIDFKSGFGSNEKGNTNRLLFVGNLYAKIIDKSKCILLVRQAEGNNNYFKRLVNSGIWEGYVGRASYAKIRDLTGFDIDTWIQKNIDFKIDLPEETLSDFKARNISRYLEW